MLIENLNRNSLTYLERYVNNGSPSGFSIKCSTSKNTSPFGDTDYFNPCICYSDKNDFIEFGTVPDFPSLDSIDKNWILVHPDMKRGNFFSKHGLKLSACFDINLIPTASARTLRHTNKDVDGYFKLHYEGNIGRLKRELGVKHAISAVEISNIISELSNNKVIDKRLTHLPETGARVLTLNQEFECGMVWRENKPYLQSEEVKYMIPVFSLFSKDRYSLTDCTILEQIIAKNMYDPTTYVIEYLILPIIDCYFSLLSNSGIQAEWHAQNLLVGFNKDFLPIQFITRDLESMDKDLTLIKQLNLPYSFESYPFKCIDSSQENYQIKHSFMFDFKLGEYIIQPLLNFLESSYFISLEPIIPTIYESSRKLIKNLPDDFFPRNKWFAFKNVKIDRSTNDRPYIEFSNPKFR